MSSTPQERVDAARAQIQEAEEELAEARLVLEDVLADLWDDGSGLSYRELADLSGFGKQHAGDLVQRSIARRREPANA